jgi:thiamine biosynthesis lipoprotein ApbE
VSANVLGMVDDRALGTSMRLIVTRPEALAAAKEAADRVIKSIDEAASRFHEDSELSRVNREAGREIRISPLLTQAIAAGLRGARLTGGAVDPTVGTAVRLAGYDRDFASIPPDGSPINLSVTRVRGWQAIQFDEGARVVLVPKGVEVDLGATAKALAADLAAAAALQALGAGGGVLVSLGGDIAVAGEPPVGGWAVQASEDSNAPLDDDEEAITIESGGVATSSTTVRRWTRGGVIVHHIIDPATGLPVDGPWRTATAAAATCVDANIASTAAIVMGERALDWLDGRGLAARLVDQDGRIAHTPRWPEPADSKLLPNIF